MDKTKYSNIKLIVSNVDGIFTSGRGTYDRTGSIVSKDFLDKDFMALSKLREFFNVVIMSSEEYINRNVFKQKGFKFYCSVDKKKILKKILMERSITPDECIYVGDDLLDLPCIRLVSYPFCPVDAFEEVKDVATILPVAGGNGVIYRLYKILSEEMTIRYKFYK